MGKKKPKTTEVESKQTDHSKDSKTLKKGAILASLANGSTRQAACDSACISVSGFWHWRKEDEAFEQEVIDAEQGAIGQVEDALYGNAIEGNTTAQIFYLCNRARDRWESVNKTKIEHTGKITNLIELADKVLWGNDKARERLASRN